MHILDLIQRNKSLLPCIRRRRALVVLINVTEPLPIFGWSFFCFPACSVHKFLFVVFARTSEPAPRVPLLGLGFSHLKNKAQKTTASSLFSVNIDQNKKNKKKKSSQHTLHTPQRSPSRSASDA